MKQEHPKCLICGAVCCMHDEKYCVSIEEGRTILGPLYGGVICHAEGNYGSGEYDPIDPTDRPLYFVLCDKCFREKRSEMTVPPDVTKHYKELYEELLKEKTEKKDDK